MSTATETDVDELVEIFGLESPEDADPCESVRMPTNAACPNEAVFVIRWAPAGWGPENDCKCGRVSKVCLRHGEGAMTARANGGAIACKVCDLFMIPAHIDRIRRG